MKKLMQNKLTLILAVAVLFTFISMSGATYAIYLNKDTGSIDNYATGNIDLTFTESSTLSLVNAFPITDALGETSDPYTLTIKNTGNLTYTFNLKVLNTTATNAFNSQYIKIKVDDMPPTSLLAADGILKSNITLLPGRKISVKVRVWLDYNTPNTEIGKTFSAKAVTDGYAVYTDENIKPLFADAVIALSKGDTWEAGVSGVYATNSYDDNGTTNYHEYRYVGAEVNNWVSFNNDMYRIIGVFDSNSHGKEGEYLVKLISANILGGYSWGVYNTSNTSGTYSSYKNDWTGNTTGVKANLNVLLNDYFYNKTNTSGTYGTCSNWTYFYNSNDYRTNDCSMIVGYGIDSNLRNYIETVTWYLYGTGSDLSKQNFYACERGGNSCTSGNNGAYSTSTLAPIGLMYVSDYLYGSSYFTSGDTSASNSNNFGNKNWLYQGWEWTITPSSTNGVISWVVSSGRVIDLRHANDPNGARPTFYLKSDIPLKGGEGTFDNPYTIE